MGWDLRVPTNMTKVSVLPICRYYLVLEALSTVSSCVSRLSTAAFIAIKMRKIGSPSLRYRKRDHS
jgi:hypothetical protein